MPLISLPIVGTLNYWSTLGTNANGGGFADGVFILGAALIATVLTIAKKYQALIIAAFGAIVVTSIDLANVVNVVNESKASIADKLQGNPFAGLAIGLANSIQVQWGWAVLYLGAAVLAYVAIKSMGIDNKAAAEVVEILIAKEAAEASATGSNTAAPSIQAIEEEPKP